MGKSHLKRLAAPKAWELDRKRFKFAARPAPGPHRREFGMPLSIILKEMLSYAGTTHEVKKIISAHQIKIDGVVRKDFRFPVSVFDTIEIPDVNVCFRAMLNRSGKLSLVSIGKSEALLKPCKIMGKTSLIGKLQLNLYDGNNLLVDKDTYKVGDTVLLSLPDKKITKHLKLDKKSTILLVGGKHVGEVGNIESISRNKIIYKNQDGNTIETSKDYAFVIGDSQPLVTIK